MMGVFKDVKKLKETVYGNSRKSQGVDFWFGYTLGLDRRVKYLEEELCLLKTYLKVKRADRPEQKRLAPVKKGRN